MRNNIKEHGRWLLALLVFVLVAYFPFAFYLHPGKWDLINLTYPWRHVLSDSLRNHMLPLWNPYQNMGYAFHIDLQTWYPVAWFFAYFTEYNIYSLHTEVVLHLLLAAIGSYVLFYSYSQNKLISFVLAISYVGSGFFVGHMQHLGWLVSAAWLPWILWRFNKLLQLPGLTNALLFSFVFYLFFTGGYIAFAFVTVYILAILCVANFYVNYKTHQIVSLKGLLYTIISGVLVFLYSLPAVVSVLNLDKYVNRGKPVSIEDSLFGAFTPQSFISLLTPFASVRDNWEFFNTDVTMTNAYMGIVALFFLVLSVNKEVLKSRNALWLWGALFFLLASAGKAFYIRQLLYYLPLLNYFRFPSLLRLFFILFTLIFVAKQSPLVLSRISSLFARRTALLFGCIFFVIVVFFSPNLEEVFKGGLFTAYASNRDLYAHILFSALTGLLTALLVWFSLKSKLQERALLWLVLISFADLSFNALQIDPYTAIDENINFKSCYEYYNSLPKGFPVPDVKPLNDAQDKTEKALPLYENLNHFTKQYAYTGYNPYWMKEYEYLTDTFPEIGKQLGKNYFVFVSHSYRNLVHLSEDYKNGRIHRYSLYGKDTISLPETLPDSISDQVKVLKVKPGYVEAFSQTQNKGILVLMQNYTPDWTVTVNGHEALLLQLNYCMQGVELPAGKTWVKFQYNPKNVIKAFYISMVGIVSAVFALLVLIFRNKRL